MFDSFLKTLTGPCMVREGDTVLACCSGGLDSMVLLDLLVLASVPLHLRVGVVHVDHGIREEVSWKDALFVSEHCEKRGLPCHVYQLGMSPDEPNLEEHARLRRYGMIYSCMNEHGYISAATGHTLDDQAETLVYRLIRGSGIRGLAGMEYRGANGLIRPMLPFTREQIEGYAAQRGIGHVEDSTNLDTTFARNLIRREIIPVMRRINPSAAKAISRLADIARQEGEFLEGRATALEGSSRVFDWSIVRAYRLADLESAPPAVLKRMIIRIVSAMLNEPRGIDSLQVEGIMEVVAGGKAAHTIRRKVTVRRDSESLVFSAAGTGPFYDFAIPESGTYLIEPLHQQVRIEFDKKPGLPFHLRSHLDGERFQGKRVVRLLADGGVMKSLRLFWPVLVSGAEIVSIAGLWDSGDGAVITTEFPCRD